MGKGKKLLILLAVVALLAGGYFAAKHFLFDDEAEKTDSESETVPVGALQADEVAGILYVCGDETIELRKDGDTWRLKSDGGFPVKQAYADTMASEAANLEAQRLVSENADDFAQYGLDAPETAFVFTKTDGTQVTFYIGSYNNFGGTYYMNVAGTEKIYLISGEFLDAFDHPLRDLADVEALQTVSTQDVRDLTLTLDGETTRVFHAEDGLKTVYTDMFTWFSDERTPVDAAVAQDFIGKAVSFTQSGCADYKADDEELAQYGLDEPVLTAKIEYTVSERKETGETDEDGEAVTETLTHDESMTLLVGGAAKDGSLYAKTDASDVVYLLDAEYLKTLRDFDLKTLRNMRLCAVQSTDVRSMDVTIEGDSATVTIERTKSDDDKQTAVYKVDGTQITAEEFNEFYASIQSIYAEDFTDKEVSVKDAPIAVTFHTTRAGFETITLRLAPYDRNFYVSQDGALVNIRDAEKIIRTFETIREK
jgi:hypothetical protein